MNGWRGSWAAAQITGVVLSSLVWIVVWGLSLPALGVVLAVGVAAVSGRNTRALLWWRFGARPASYFQHDTMLAAIIPIASLRGRHQPSVFIGQRLLGGDAVMPSRTVLVVSQEFVRQLAIGQLTDRQASAIVCQALGYEQVLDSTLVSALEAYCLPWRLVQIVISAVSPFAAWHGSLRSSWKFRWIVFGAAIVDNCCNARWAALVGVIVIAALSCSTGYFQTRWTRSLQDLGDQRAVIESLGPDLADAIRRGDSSLATSDRADRLRRVPPSRMGGGGSLPEGVLRASPTESQFERRVCGGRKHR